MVLILPLTASPMDCKVLLHFQFLYNHSRYGFISILSHPIVFSAHDHLLAFCPLSLGPRPFSKDHCWRSALPSNPQYDPPFSL